ncbi:MAG TPA: YfiR family protein, partial [bacterium]|nr:YfiR family protein [bacterium]
GFLMLVIPALQAQVVKVPADIQMRLMVKILAYERDHRFDSDNFTNVVVLYHSKVSGSVAAKDAVINAHTQSPLKVNRAIIRFIPIDISTVGDIGEELHRQGARVVYLTPMRGVNIGAIINACRAQSILSVSGVYDFAQFGATISFDLLDNKPKFIINTTSAKLEQVVFSSDLLKLATVIE